MNNKEAVRVLEEGSAYVYHGDFVDAYAAGADALRRLDELEKWAEAWKTETKNAPLPGDDDDLYFWELFISALRGEMEWPGKE